MAVYDWPNFGIIVTCDGCDLVVHPFQGSSMLVLGEADGQIIYSHEDDDCIAEAARRFNLRERAAGD